MTTPYDDLNSSAGQDRGIGLPVAREGQAGGEGRTGVREKIGEQARTAARQAREKAGNAFAERKTEVAGQVSSVADAVRNSSSQLRGSGHDQIAGITESIAEQAERAASYLRDADLRSIRRDFEDLARRQPMLVIGGALALGLIGARFLRSSGRREADFDRDREFDTDYASGGFDATA
jgi:hypothetical protein